MSLKSASPFLSALFLLAVFGRAEGDFLVLERLGQAQVRFPAATHPAAAVPTWREVEKSMKIPPGSLLRTGEASILRLWLRPLAKLSMGEKSKLLLTTQFTGSRQIHLAMLEEGRACLEAPSLDETVLHELRLGEVRVQCGLGKLLASRTTMDNTAMIWQVEGESHVTADVSQDNVPDPRGIKLDSIRGVSMRARERLTVRELRYAKRDYEGLPEGFGFAFVKPLVKPRGSESYLDKRERWE
jgi:hypothetical protein